METDDPRALEFPAAEFREGIQFAMLMAIPNRVELRTTFRWKDAKSYPRTDPAGRPYSHDAAPTATSSIADLQLTVATVPGEPGRTGRTNAAPVGPMTPIGQFEQSKITVILLDKQWDELMAHSGDKLPDEIVAGGTTYINVIEAMPIALFPVDIRTLYAVAPDTA